VFSPIRSPDEQDVLRIRTRDGKCFTLETKDRISTIEFQHLMAVAKDQSSTIEICGVVFSTIGLLLLLKKKFLSKLEVSLGFLPLLFE
jgi:hypothetical protein